MAEKGETPRGIVMVLVNERGMVVAHSADFECAGYGGFTLSRAQEMRARRKLEVAFINAYGGPILAKAADEHHVRQMIRNLADNCGWKVQTIEVGGEENTR